MTSRTQHRRDARADEAARAGRSTGGASSRPPSPSTTAGRSGSSSSSSSRGSPTARAPRQLVPDDQTVLANEQVIDGRCERCGAGRGARSRAVVLPDHGYADQLLDDMAMLESWPERVLTMQRNWIGRSEGAEVVFRVEELDDRPPCLHDAAGHALRRDVLRARARAPARRAPGRRDSRTSRRSCDYVKHAAAPTPSERDRRQGEDRRLHRPLRHNPVNDERIPVWIADYVLMDYGTGAIMAVPAHDQRDFEFAGASSCRSCRSSCPA